MKFMIVTKQGTRYIDAEDFSEAADYAYDDHTEYRDVIAIIKVSND